MGMLNSLARLIQWVLVSGSAFVLSLNDWLACFFLSGSFSVLTGAQKLCLCLCLCLSVSACIMLHSSKASKQGLTYQLQRIYQPQDIPERL